ncbi:hypothetical protein DNH61_11700 [Paenibacillus sambharensis]|uniref:Uncharacterized protein n=1 Tax=Paenibacillus sambharensis TaxID=1803190 RepID=A0A2W1LUP3_9BACL|nr:hypothetical protein [Paenibacillus sambharensis]PZD95217.1 hypothetical protein DNH61_11700 [Paenibacillus sambharensis]
MKISHEEYLKRVLFSKQLQLENLNIAHRVAIAEYEKEKTMLHKDINSLENQLNDAQVEQA